MTVPGSCQRSKPDIPPSGRQRGACFPLLLTKTWWVIFWKNMKRLSQRPFTYSSLDYSPIEQSLYRIICLNFLRCCYFIRSAEVPGLPWAVWFSGSGNGPWPPGHFGCSGCHAILPSSGDKSCAAADSSTVPEGTIISFTCKPSLSLIQIGRAWKEGFLPRAPRQQAKRQWGTVAELWGESGLILPLPPTHCVTLGNVLDPSVPQFYYLKQEVIIAPVGC